MSSSELEVERDTKELQRILKDLCVWKSKSQMVIVIKLWQHSPTANGVKRHVSIMDLLRQRAFSPNLKVAGVVVMYKNYAVCLSSHIVPICPVNAAFSDVTQEFLWAFLIWSSCCKMSIWCPASPLRCTQEGREESRAKGRMPWGYRLLQPHLIFKTTSHCHSLVVENGQCSFLVEYIVISMKVRFF